MVFLQASSLGHAWVYGQVRTPKYERLALPKGEFGMIKEVF